MIRLGRGIRRGLRAVLPAVLLALALAAPAAADTLLVQPDGKIVLAGKAYPAFGTLARLLPDGSPDPSFGQGGFVLDQRTASFSALAADADGRLVVAPSRGAMLARYGPDGAVDSSFGADGLGGAGEVKRFALRSKQPSAVVVRPDGSLVVATNVDLGGGSAEAWVKRYDGSGNLIEIVGRVPQLSGVADSSYLYDLLETPAGALFGAGYTYETSVEVLPYLARFLPGSGTHFDPGFGGGAGLVSPRFPSEPLSSPSFDALAMAGDKLLAAGRSAETFLLARFDQEGNLDPGFGAGGYVAPPISGPASGFGYASSWAKALAVMPDGGIVLGGGTSQWGDWEVVKMPGPICNDCPQPLLARFDSSGRLDPGFGSGGIKHLVEPDGSTFIGEIHQATALPDGKILVNGYFKDGGRYAVATKPFVARLNPDGSYDPGFGDGGVVSPQFPCAGHLPERLRKGCLPSARLALRLRGLPSGRPALSLRVSPDLFWAEIEEVELTLPRGVRPTRKLRSRLRMTAIGGSDRRGRVEVVRPEQKNGETALLFDDFQARELRLSLKHGSLCTAGRDRAQRGAVRLGLRVVYRDTIRGYTSSQELVRRLPTG